VRRTLFKSKIHRATVTHADLHYEGSVTIDAELLAAADILPYERVSLWNVTNGSRLETYALEGEPGSGVVCVNGAAAHHARPGDVMVVAADAYEEASVVGDILVGMAKNKGVAALITDGMARDVDGLNAVGIPIFARGLSPNSPYKDGPGEIGLPIAIGGATVNPGDLVVGDQDGLVVVAREALAAVADALAEVKAKEAKMDELVRKGATSGPWLAQALEEKGVRYLD